MSGPDEREDRVEVAVLAAEHVDAAVILLHEAGLDVRALRLEGDASGRRRILVAPDEADQAHQLLAERLPQAVETRTHAGGIADEPAAADGAVDDQAWAEIVAAFRAPAADVSGRRLPPPVQPPAPVQAAELPPALDPLDVEEHFEPEPPPPLPRLGWLLTSAWVGVVGTPLLFLLALWVHVDVTGWLGAAGVAVFVGSFLVLVSRLGDGPDDWDDGAVV
ncbi:hypothetical protein EV189_1299 [Motilibacter rhizosphaerae]|uniref:Uncharacterized protein n=1 Tax=Motilibacter rhizosphaerae TaxID=598652 RepID=A0A4Q7NT24_9ACTN|nr:hypothetical protein [Motilibacter rhizosphaerae]RZS89532.1 hypothetical protein EV189_1299 [Motilibacter rhizosphaerae]